MLPASPVESGCENQIVGSPDSADSLPELFKILEKPSGHRRSQRVPSGGGSQARQGRWPASIGKLDPRRSPYAVCNSAWPRLQKGKRRQLQGRGGHASTFPALAARSDSYLSEGGGGSSSSTSLPRPSSAADMPVANFDMDAQKHRVGYGHNSGASSAGNLLRPMSSISERAFQCGSPSGGRHRLRPLSGVPKRPLSSSRIPTSSSIDQNYLSTERSLLSTPSRTNTADRLGGGIAATGAAVSNGFLPRPLSGMSRRPLSAKSGSVVFTDDDSSRVLGLMKQIKATSDALPSVSRRLRSWQMECKGRDHVAEWRAENAGPLHHHHPSHTSDATLVNIDHNSSDNRSGTSDDGSEDYFDCTVALNASTHVMVPVFGKNVATDSECTLVRRTSLSDQRVRTKRGTMVCTGGGFLGESGKMQAMSLFIDAFQVAGELPSTTHALCEVFERGRYYYNIRFDWLFDIIDNELFGRSMLDLEDFTVLWDVYGQRLDTQRREAFNKFASVKNTVFSSHLRNILTEMGVPSMPEAIEERLAELLPERPAGKVVELNFTLVNDVASTLYKRCGLTKSEEARLVALYDRYRGVREDREGIFASDLAPLMHWHDLLVGDFMGLVSEGVVDSLVKELIRQIKSSSLLLDADAWRKAIDPDTLSSSYSTVTTIIPKHAFLLIGRMLHETIRESLFDVVLRLGLDQQAEALMFDKVLNIFNELGSVSSDLREVLNECMQIAGFEDNCLSFDQVYKLVFVYCKEEGILKSERAQLDWLFNMFTTQLPDVAKDAAGRLDTIEIPRALRWLCYCPTLYRLFDFLERSNRCEREFMDSVEFSKAVVDYRWANMSMARDAFRLQFPMSDVDDLPDLQRKPLSRKAPSPGMHVRWQRVDAAELKHLFILVGHQGLDNTYAAVYRQARVDAKGTIDWAEFMRLEVLYRETMKEVFKEHLGYSLSEMADLRVDFTAHVRNVACDEAIVFDGLQQIIANRFPEVKIDDSVRELVAASDLNNNKKIEFKEFLWIMRRMQDKCDKAFMSSIAAIRQQMGCTKGEMGQLRELFNSTDTDMSGFITFSQLQALFSGLVPMSAESVIELRSFTEEAANINPDRWNNTQTLDFWHFLHLFKIVQEQNWRNITGVAKGMVKEKEEEPSPMNLSMARTLRRSLL